MGESSGAFSTVYVTVIPAANTNTGLIGVSFGAPTLLYDSHALPFAGGLLSYFRNLLGSREMRILILGLDGAGKTTILYRFGPH